MPAEPKVPQGRLPSAFSALARRIDGLFTLRESAAYAGRTLLGVETLEQRALFSVTLVPLDPTHLVHMTGPDGGPSQPSDNPIVTQVGNLNDLQDKSGGGVPSLPVESANRPPILAGPGLQSGAVGDTVSLVVAGLDPDGDRLTYQDGGTLPAGLSLDASTGSITGTLTGVGTYSATITVDDGRGGTATAYFSWGVADNATPTTTTLVATQGDPEDESQPADLTLTATVAGSGSTPTGMVYFYDNGSVVGMASVNAAGVAACTVVNPTDGTHVLTAVYQGDATSDSSGSSAVEVTVVITRATTITKFNVHTLWPDDYAELPGVMLIAAVAPQSGSETPTGTVTFTDDGATVGTVQLVNGVATLTIPHIVAGSHAYIANYKGDSAYRASVSLAITQTLKVYSGGNGGEFFVPSNSETLINTEASELDPPETPPAPIIQPMGEDLTWKNYEKITAAQVKDRLPDGYDLPLFGKDIAAMTVWNFVGKYSFDYNTKIVAGNITDGYSARVSTTQVVVKFSAVFNPKGSFVVKGYETGNDQEILLFHERTHLMLAEYVAARSAPNLPAISAKGAIGGAGSEEFALGGATARMKSDINAQLDTFRLKIHKVDNKVQDAYHDALTGTPAEAEVAQLKWYRNHTYYADPVIQNAGFIE